MKDFYGNDATRLKDKKLFLFDMDGTITNTLDDLADATNYALSAFGFKTHETDAFRYFVGDGIPKLIERALPEEKDSRKKEEKSCRRSCERGGCCSRGNSYRDS